MNNEQTYNITFVGDYFVLTTHINAETEDQAIDNAIANLEDRHGFNVREEAFDITAEVVA